MKTLPRVSLFLALCFVALPAVAQPAAVELTGPEVAGAAASLWQENPVLARLNSFYEKTTDFSAAFKQVVNTKSPKRTFRRSGSVFFKRPGLMRWDYKVPEAVHYVSDGTLLWAYDSEDRSVVKMKVADSDMYSSLGFLSGTSSLADSFVPDVKPAQKAGHSVVTLVPFEASGNYRYLTLLVVDATGEVVETEVVDPLGNKSRITFESPVYTPIAVKSFDFKIPAGVSVQDLTRQ